MSLPKSAWCALIFGALLTFTNAGKHKGKSRIIGGYDCSPDDYKSVIIIQNPTGTKCGGTLLNEKWALTAAHCDTVRMVVAAGISTNPDCEEVITKVRQFYIHPSFDRPPFNDIALVRLDAPIKETACIEYVKLPNKSLTELCTQAVAIGLGSVVSTVPMQFPKRMQCVLLPVISDQRCKALVPTYKDSLVCTLSFKRQDTCKGDSGGPVMCGDVQIGIIIWGEDCAQPFKPGVYVRVHSYLDFIHATMKNSGTGNSFCYSLTIALPIFTIIKAF